MTDKPLKPPRDPAQLAKLMIDIASGEVTEDQPTAKQARAHKAGTKGGLHARRRSHQSCTSNRAPRAIGCIEAARRSMG